MNVNLDIKWIMVVAVIKIFHGLIFFDFFNEKCLNEKIT